MSKIDLYSKFITKQSKMTENSSISRNKISEDLETSKRLDDELEKRLLAKTKKAGLDKKSGEATLEAGKVTQKNGQNVPLNSSDQSEVNAARDLSAKMGNSPSQSSLSYDAKKREAQRDVMFGRSMQVGKTTMPISRQTTPSSTTSSTEKSDGTQSGIVDTSSKSSSDEVNKTIKTPETSIAPNESDKIKILQQQKNKEQGISLTPDKSRPDAGAVSDTKPELTPEVKSIDPDKDPANEKYKEKAAETKKETDAEAKTEKNKENSDSKQSTNSEKRKPKETESREKRMARAVQSGNLQDVISGTYGEETKTLTKQIIEKYSCGCGNKMKKKKDK